MRIFSVGGVEQEDARIRRQPFEEGSVDEIRGARAEHYALRWNAPHCGNCIDQARAGRGGRGSSQPRKVFPQGGERARSGREPGIEYIRVDDLSRPLQVIERWADGLEECSSVVTVRRRVEREAEPPFAGALQALHCMAMPCPPGGP